MKLLTGRQEQVLLFIREYTGFNSYPPTMREIAAHLGVSLRAVQNHLSAIEHKGYISSSFEKRSRSIKIVSSESDSENVPVLTVPLIGSVAAGKPLLCVENYDGNVFVSAASLRKGKTHFALRVQGDSMTGAGILDGDIAVIEQATSAENGKIVVAVVNDAITLKRFFREPSRIRLQAENPAFSPMYCQDVRVAGILVHIMRDY